MNQIVTLLICMVFAVPAYSANSTAKKETASALCLCQTSQDGGVILGQTCVDHSVDIPAGSNKVQKLAKVVEAIAYAKNYRCRNLQKGLVVSRCYGYIGQKQVIKGGFAIRECNLK